MISTGTTIQINGKVTASSAGSITVSADEMLVGTIYYTFETPKEITVATTDYSTTALSVSEKAVANKLAEQQGKAVALTQIELIATNSLASKL